MDLTVKGGTCYAWASHCYLLYSRHNCQAVIYFNNNLLLVCLGFVINSM